MKKLNLPTPLGRMAGAELDRIYNLTLQESGDNDERCHDCAFRKGTMPNGCEATVYDAVMCTVNGNTFECHINVGQMCAGFAQFKNALPSSITAELLNI